MKTLSKKSFIVLFSLITVLMFAVSAMFVAGNVKASETTTPPAIVMEKGASARVGVDEVNGLRFIAGMSNEDYGWFAKNVGEDKDYASVKFGMVIAPKNYVNVAGKEFTEANLFGESAIYTWATFKDGAWDESTVDANKVRIINIVADEMSTYIDNDGNEKMAVTGAIKDYKEHNIVRDFVGRGYYQLFDGAGNLVKTELASYAENDVENNTRSMIEVVQASIENGVLDDEQLTSATTTYFDTIADNVKPANSKIDVLLDKTVAGDDNSVKTAIDVTTVVYTSEAGNETEFKLNSWKTQATALSVTDGVVTASNVCGGNFVTSTYLGLTITVDAYVPISSRADMDALGFDYLEDQTVNYWGTGNRYMLTNDIDYATDTSTYGSFRMDDGNGTQDLWDRYLIPIAASFADYGRTASWNSTGSGGSYEWGIFGQIGADGKFFYGIIDGAGFAIKNAVIPYGTIFAKNAVYCNHGANFIGNLVYGGQLRNIAFTGLEFEDVTQIGGAVTSTDPYSSNNPYYTANNGNNAGKWLEANGYITQTTINGTYGYSYYNPSNRTGLVGSMQNAVISNVYVEAVMKNGTFGTGAVNGLIVANIDVDYLPDGVNPYMGTFGKVENCIVNTSYSSATNVAYLGAINSYTSNSGMGAIVGKSNITTESSINNCFVVGDLKVNFGSGAVALDTIFSPNLGYQDGKYAGKNLSTNCGIYADVASLQAAQASVLENMSIAKYLG